MTPFEETQSFGINSDHAFIPFNTMGTVVHFDSCEHTEWDNVLMEPNR